MGRTVIRVKKWMLLALLAVGFAGTAAGQDEAGFMFPSRFGLSYQKAVGIDVGLVSFNQWSDQNGFVFYDFSLGVESFIAKPFVMAPKFNFDFGFGGVLAVGGGLDIAMPTDFSRAAWVFTPKAGISLMSIIRLYYGRHLGQGAQEFPGFGKHRISLEVNIAAFHDFKIGL